MRIELETDGGFATFPGLNRPMSIDTATLAPEDAKAVEAAVQDSRFFARSEPERAMPPGAADHRSYTITVVDGAQRRTLRLNDPVTDEHLATLISRLRAAGRRS